MTLVIDIHALQSLPPSNINRDDTGAPKSAVFGGVPRQRVSSQSWKRAIRRDFEENLGAESVGFRTKRVADLVSDKIVTLTAASGNAWDVEKAAEASKALFAAAGIKLVEPKAKANEEKPARGAETGYLLFLSPRQIENAARHLIESGGIKPSKSDAKKLLDDEHSIDIAMFGRMVADAPDYNVDAAVQVAHAIGVHESEPDFDYYTAVDDIVEDNQESGAGMIGTTQMMSSTLYRFATVDMVSLESNLGDEETARTAAVSFLRSFITSLPTGKQNSFAHNTLPELVYVTIRDTRSVSLVNAFEEPVCVSDGTGRRLEAAKRLATESRELAQAYGFTPRSAFVIGLGDLVIPFEDLAQRVDLESLCSGLTTALEEARR